MPERCFLAGSNLKDKSPEEIFYQDYKKFIGEGNVSFGVGQISSMDSEELKEIKEKLMPFMVSECGRHDITRVYFYADEYPGGVYRASVLRGGQPADGGDRF